MAEAKEVARRIWYSKVDRRLFGRTTYHGERLKLRAFREKKGIWPIKNGVYSVVGEEPFADGQRTVIGSTNFRTGQGALDRAEVTLNREQSAKR